tara:strand:+ start:216 stop:455 length:240 start_codon:yes stop_codon:yes gene_type:complete
MENCAEKGKRKIKIKVKRAWDNSSLRFNQPTEKEIKQKEYLDKVEEINLKLLDLECQIDCLLKKKKHYLELCGVKGLIL